MKKEFNLTTSIFEEVKNRIVTVRNVQVILDVDVASLYGVETKRINEAVRNNRDKFPESYLFQLTQSELTGLRSKFSTANISSKSRYLPKAFTEKGLYMLATILKSKTAVATTFAIIETFASVRMLRRELIDLHAEDNPEMQQIKMNRFGDLLSDIVMPELQTSETESSLEINFFIGKIKHTVKRTKKK